MMRIRSTMMTLLAVALIAGGCTGPRVGGPSSAELGSIRADNAAVVLVRITLSEDGKPIDPLRPGGWGRGAVHLWAFEIGAQRPIKWRRGRTLSATAAKEAWLYEVLPAGSYRIVVSNTFSGGKSWRTADGSGRPTTFWLNVPRGGRVIYAGSIHIACQSNWKGTGSAACSGDLKVADETERARAIASAGFATLGAPRTSLMTRYGGPIARTALAEMKPVALAASGPGQLVSPQWRQRSAKRFLGWGAGVARCSGSAYGCAGLVMLYLAYLPFGAAAAAIDADQAKSKWGPCVANMAKELKSLQPSSKLRELLAARLGKRAGAFGEQQRPGGDLVAAASRRGFRSVLQAEVQRIQIRECKTRGSFCLEVAVRARLTDTTTRRLVHDTVLVRTNPAVRSRRFTHSMVSEVRVEPHAVCRDLKAYCGPAGARLFRDELVRSLEILVRRIAPKLADDTK